MRVTKTELINGIMDYIENEVVPQVGDKPTQIIATIALNAVRANPSMADKYFELPMVKTLLDENEDGFEIDILFKAITESMKKYKAFPVTIPPVPLISPVEKILTFSESDVSELKRRIERSAMNG